jgi:hypothetical protein
MEKEERKKEVRAMWKKLVAKAWADPDWKARLLADPVTVMREEGFSLPEGVKIRLVEELPGTRSFSLPLPPDDLWKAERLERKKAAGFCLCACSGEGWPCLWPCVLV